MLNTDFGEGLAMEKVRLFYHGTSTADICQLTPISKNHHSLEETVAYLTPNRAYALFYICYHRADLAVVVPGDVFRLA